MADPASVLTPLGVPQNVKADAWDAFNSAKDQQDFQKRFEALQIPQEAKAALWDMKYAAPATSNGPAVDPSDAALQKMLQQQGGGSQDAPWIGQPRPASEGFLSNLYHLPAYGLQDIGTGLKHLTQEGSRRQGAHELLTGAGEAAVPAAVAGGIAALPALGGAGLLPYLGSLATSAGTGAAAGGLGYGASSLLGADPETSQLVGDTTGLSGAAFGALPETQAAARAGLKELLANASPQLLRKLSLIHPLAAIPDVLQAAKNVGTAAASGWRGYVKLPELQPRTVPPVPRPDVVDLASTTGQGLPSGRLPGPVAVPAAELPTPNVVAPVPRTAPPQFSAAPGQLPSGRVPGGIANQTEMPAPPTIPILPSGVSTQRIIGATPIAAEAAAVPAADAVTFAAKLKATAKNMGFKTFEEMPDPVKTAVLKDMAKHGEMPAPPGALPTPGVSEVYKASVPQVSIIPEGEHNIVRNVSESLRGAKDNTIAKSLKDEGLTAETLDKMSDADLQKRVRALGYRPSNGVNYSRTWSAFRRDLRSLLD